MKTKKDYLKEIAENTRKIRSHIQGIFIAVIIIEAVVIAVLFSLI